DLRAGSADSASVSRSFSDRLGRGAIEISGGRPGPLTSRRRAAPKAIYVAAPAPYQPDIDPENGFPLDPRHPVYRQALLSLAHHHYGRRKFYFRRIYEAALKAVAALR